MPQYRFYNLEKDQAVIARIDLTLDDDASAIARARQLIVGEEIQVWEGSRLVASLSPLVDARRIASTALRAKPPFDHYCVPYGLARQGREFVRVIGMALLASSLRQSE
jgi:hypothetical protein